MNKPEHTTEATREQPAAPAVGAQVERWVGRLVNEARCGCPLLECNAQGKSPSNCAAMTARENVFRVTPAGKEWVAAHSPTPPKLTAGQRRYQDFLDADTCMTFGEWLKARRAVCAA